MIIEVVYLRAAYYLILPVKSIQNKWLLLQSNKGIVIYKGDKIEPNPILYMDICVWVG